MGLNKLELECKILAGAESKAFLVELAKMTERLEKVASILRAPGQAAPEETESEEMEDFEDTAPAAKAAKAPPADDFGDEETAPADDDFEADEETPAPKAKKEKTEKAAKAEKAPKITIDDVNDACKAKVKDLMAKKSCDGKAARAMVLKALKKNFNVESVTELKPEQYAGVITLMKG